MAEWTDWADGNDLANLSRGTSPLASRGYDTDELRVDPTKRDEAMKAIASPMAPPPNRAAILGRQQIAQNTLPPNPAQDQRTAVPEGEPPNPTLSLRPNPVRGAGAAMADVAGTAASLPETLSAPSTTTPASPAKPTGVDWQGLAQRSAEGSLGTADESRQLYESAPQAPNTSAIDTRIETESVPTNPRDVDPVTGKPLYKPSAWNRIERGIAAFGAGGLPAVLDPARAGATPYGAPNKDYQEDEATRQGQLAADQQRKTDAMNRFKTLTDQVTGRAKNIESVQPGYKDAGTIANDAQKQQTDTAKEAREAQENSPEGKAAAKTAISQAEFDQLNRQADRIFGSGRGGMQRSLYLANNGKIPDPRQASAEEIARGQAMNVFRRQNGRGPQTMDEINQVNSAAAGRLRGSEGNDDDTAVGAIIADQTGKKNEFVSQFVRQPDGSYLRKGVTNPFNAGKDDKLSGEEFNAKVDQFRLDANKQLEKHGAQMDATGQIVHRGPGAPQSTSAGALPPVPKGRVAVSVPGPGGPQVFHFPNQKAAGDFKKKVGL